MYLCTFLYDRRACPFIYHVRQNLTASVSPWSRSSTSDMSRSQDASLTSGKGPLNSSSSCISSSIVQCFLSLSAIQQAYTLFPTQLVAPPTPGTLKLMVLTATRELSRHRPCCFAEPISIASPNGRTLANGS